MPTTKQLNNDTPSNVKPNVEQGLDTGVNYQLPFQVEVGTSTPVMRI